MKKKNFIISLLSLAGILLSSCALAREKQELVWSKWYDNGDGTHSRHSMSDISIQEKEEHHLVLTSTIEEPTEVTPGKAMYTCEKCACKEEMVVPPTGNYVFNQKVVDDKYLLEKYSEHSAVYYMSSVEGAFGDPRYVFEVSDVPSGYTEVDYVESDGRQWIDTGIKNDNYHDVIINNSSKNTRIPADFQELEYIESSGVQYIDTGVKVSSNASYELTYQYKQMTTDECDIFGSDVYPFDFVGVCDGKFRYISYEGTILYQNMDTHKHHLVKRYNQVKVDDVVLHSTESPASNDIQANYYLFAASDEGEKTINYFCNAKLFECKIWINNELEREFVPAKRLSDNAVGLYDAVDNKFYLNSGSGQFAAGSEVQNNPIVLPEGYQELRYIESTGTEQIDLNTPFDLENGSIEIDFQSTLLDQNGMIIGNWFGDYHINYLWLYHYRDYPNGITICINGDMQSQQNLGASTTDLEKHNAVYRNKTFILDGVEKESASGSLGISDNLYLFSSGSTLNYTGRIFNFKLDNGNGLVRNMVPCYRISDGVVGMYDFVSDQLFVNSGSGAFQRGPEVENNRAQLPSEYQQVEYVRSDGNQWIDAQVVYNEGDTAGQVVDVQFLDTSMRWCGANWYLQYGFDPNYVDTHDRVTLSQQFNNKNLKTYVNGTLMSDETFDRTIPANIGTGVFRLGDSNGAWYETSYDSCHPSSQILYSLKIYKNGALVRDFVPCYKKSNEEVGLYDLVSTSFFANEGTTPLQKGDKVNVVDDTKDYNSREKAGIPEYYYQLNYIESTGLQCLDTGVVGGAKIDATIKFVKNSTPQIMGYSATDGHYFGVGADNNYIGTTIEAGNIDNVIVDISNTTANKGTLSINNETPVNFDIPELGTDTLKFFSVGTQAFNCLALMYSAKIYQGETLVRDFVPVMQKQTKAVGLYDLVNQRFYESSTDYKFEAGGIMYAGINTSNINVFCNLVSNKSHPNYSKISSYKVYEGSTVVRDFVSVIRNSDGVAGLYDLKNNQFYTSNSEFPLKYGNIIGHKLDEGTVTRKATYNVEGEIVYKCIYTNEEIHLSTACTAYKVTFISDNANLTAVKIFNEVDPNNYEMSMVGYTRNPNTYNYSKSGAYIYFEIPDDGHEYTVETSSGKVSKVKNQPRQYKITNIKGDVFIQLKVK